MKKIRIKNKLFLERKIISKLDDAILDRIQGGSDSVSCPATYTCGCSRCPTYSCPKN